MGMFLQYGSRGNDVERLQILLNKHLQLRPPLKIDGIFGLQTRTAVRRLQSLSSLEVDGVVGTETWATLEGKLEHWSKRDALPISYINAPWMPVAEREIGQMEGPKTLNNPRILQYHSATSLQATADEVAWCSAFVNWCLREVKIAGTNSAAATSWLHWGKVSLPAAGAITVVRRQTGEHHVAFFLLETRSHIRLLGGNQRDEVRVSSYPKASYVVLGYRWPSSK